MAEKMIRIHHFYDMIRDCGAGKHVTPHPYGHSLHKVYQQIMDDPKLQMRIVVGADSVCENCVHLIDGRCDDVVVHRHDFSSKEEFNEHIDRRILQACNLNEGDFLTPFELCEKARGYIEKMEWIYEGNDVENTRIRKLNFIKGLEIYTGKKRNIIL